MAERRGVQTFCRVMAALCVAGMVILPAIALFIWFAPAVFGGVIGASIADNTPAWVLVGLSTGQSVAVLAVMGGGVALQVTALWLLRRVFVEGAAGRWFSLAAVQNFRRFAWVSLALVPYSVFQASAISVITSLHLPDGERVLNVSFGSQNIQNLFGALIMLFVAHMFAAGREVDEENALML